jgi:hypothetical protein
LDREPDITVDVLGPNILVAAHTETVVKKAGRLVCPLPWSRLFTTPEEASMSAIFQVEVRFIRKNRFY